MNFSRPVHPAAYALVTATPVPCRQRERLDPRVHAPPPQRCLTRLRPDESALPAVFRRPAVQGPPGAEIERGTPAARTALAELYHRGHILIFSRANAAAPACRSGPPVAHVPAPRSRPAQDPPSDGALVLEMA